MSGSFTEMPPEPTQLFCPNPHCDVEHDGQAQRGIARVRESLTPITRLVAPTASARCIFPSLNNGTRKF